MATIEQKAKAYDEALERARIWKDKSGMPKDKQGILDDIFPELKENEDERIRKELCKAIWTYVPTEEGREYITWLEKQGEKEETLCDKCRKEQPSHSCQDITALGRCALEKQGEQKPTTKIKSAEESLGIDSETYNKIVDECVYGEQKSAWSEEDNAILEKCVGAVKSSCYSYSFKLEAENWLKSIKPKNRQKPSDEQIKTCKEVYADILSAKGFDLGTVNSELNRMEEQLKNLI